MYVPVYSKVGAASSLRFPRRAKIHRGEAIL